MESAEAIRFIQWPAGGDHEHAERPPTPGELEDAGHRSVTTIIGQAIGNG